MRCGTAKYTRLADWDDTVEVDAASTVWTFRERDGFVKPA